MAHSNLDFFLLLARDPNKLPANIDWKRVGSAIENLAPCQLESVMGMHEKQEPGLQERILTSMGAEGDYVLQALMALCE